MLSPFSPQVCLGLENVRQDSVALLKISSVFLSDSSWLTRIYLDNSIVMVYRNGTLLWLITYSSVKFFAWLFLLLCDLYFETNSETGVFYLPRLLCVIHNLSHWVKSWLTYVDEELQGNRKYIFFSVMSSFHTWSWTWLRMLIWIKYMH